MSDTKEFTRQEWRIPAEHTKTRKARVIPLAPLAMEVISERHQYRQDAVYVFAVREGKAPNRSTPQLEAKQAAEAIKIPPFTPHDLRRTFASIGESLDVSPFALKRLMNHASGQDITSGYIVLDTERLRNPMQLISDKIVKLSRSP